MLGALLVLLIVLWFLGYIHVSGIHIPDLTLFTINGQAITFVKLLIALVIMAVIGALPTPLREIAMILFVLWILATLGIIAVTGLSNILIIALIVGIGLSLLKKF
jgi:hypothetical protein